MTPPHRVWIVTIVVHDVPDAGEAFLVEREILRQFDSLDLEGGLEIQEITAEEQPR